MHLLFACSNALDAGVCVDEHAQVSIRVNKKKQCNLSRRNSGFLAAQVVTAGGELFTGNTAFLTTAVIEGKANFGQLIKNWYCSTLGCVRLCVCPVRSRANLTFIPASVARGSGVTWKWWETTGRPHTNVESMLWSLTASTARHAARHAERDLEHWHQRRHISMRSSTG